MSSTGAGFALVGAGSILFGYFPALIAKIATTSGWRFENQWLVMSFVSLLVEPVVLAFATTPNLSEVLAQANRDDVTAVLLCAAAFGLGNCGFGQTVDMIGISLASALNPAALTALGTLLPLLVFKPETFQTARGGVVIGGVVLVAVALVFSALAGVRRDHLHVRRAEFHLQLQRQTTLRLAAEAKAAAKASATVAPAPVDSAPAAAAADGDTGAAGVATTAWAAPVPAAAVPVADEPEVEGDASQWTHEHDHPEKHVRVCGRDWNLFRVGIVACVLSGCAVSLLNVGFVYGDSIAALAVSHGAARHNSGNVVWMLALFVGWAVTALYSCVLVTMRGSWHRFAQWRYNAVLQPAAAAAAPGGADVEAGKKQPDAVPTPISWAHKWFGNAIALSVLMGLMQYSAIACYGIGAKMLGSLGSSAGFAIFAAGEILTGVVTGVVAGDWQHSDAACHRLMVASVLVLLGAIALFASAIAL